MDIPGHPLSVLWMRSRLDEDCRLRTDFRFWMTVRPSFKEISVKEAFPAKGGLALQNSVSHMRHVLTIVFHYFILWIPLSNLDIRQDNPVNILTKFYVCNQFTVTKLIQQRFSMITRGGDSNVMLLQCQT